jgi:hypothetical protein
VQAADRPKAPGDAGDGDVERKAAGRSGRLEALELVAATRARRARLGDRTDQEQIVLCAVRK